MAFSTERVYHDDRRFGEHAGWKAQRQEDQLAMEAEAGGGSIWVQWRDWGWC